MPTAAGGDVGFAADGLGVVDLVAGADGDLLGGVVAAGGDIDEIDARLLEEFGEGDGLGEIPACAEGLRGPVGGGDADEERQVLGPAARTARTTSRGKRTRFSKLPPYSSVRWLESGERNSWRR